MLNSIKNEIAITLSRAVQTLGPMPDECGTGVKKILVEDDFAAIMSLGCYLEDSIRNKDYSFLTKGLNDIALAQSRGDI